jgi:TctA family transporter
MVLGPMMEENLRRSLLISEGDPSIFVTRPLSAGFIVATVLLLLLFAVPALRRKRREVIVD